MILQKEYRIVGKTPLLMHSSRGVDPLDEYSRAIEAITSRNKRKAKSLEDHMEIKRLEFLRGLWLDYNGEPCIPAYAVKGMVCERPHRLSGVGKADFRSGVTVAADAPLEYDGPRDPAELYEAGGFLFSTAVRVQNARVIRTRPMFREWGATLKIELDTDVMGGEKFDAYLITCGERVGLGDWRPDFGRFTVEVLA